MWTIPLARQPPACTRLGQSPPSGLSSVRNWQSQRATSSLDHSLLFQEFVHLGPKVLQERGRIFEPIRPNRLQAVPVVKRTPALATGPRRLPDGMGVVKSDQPAAARTVQRQRVVQPMRPAGRGNYPADRDPTLTLCLA